MPGQRTALGVTLPEGGWFVNANAGATWRPVDRLSFSAGAFHANRDAWVLWQRGRELGAFAMEQWSPRARFDAFFTARQQLRVQAEWTAIKAQGDRRLRIDADGKLKPMPGEVEDFSIGRMTLQVRYRWQIAPLSDLFVVYNRNGSLYEAAAERSFADLFSDAYGDAQREAVLVKLRYRFGT